MIRGKVAEYMERAEKLKQHLNQNDETNRKKPSAMGANGKSSGGSGKGGKYVPDCPRSATKTLTRYIGTTRTRVTPSLRSFAVRSPAPFSQKSQTFDGKT
jgi:vacuolar protein-sorting-associated protein 4